MRSKCRHYGRRLSRVLEGVYFHSKLLNGSKRIITHLPKLKKSWNASFSMLATYIKQLHRGMKVCTMHSVAKLALSVNQQKPANYVDFTSEIGDAGTSSPVSLSSACNVTGCSARQ